MVVPIVGLVGGPGVLAAKLGAPADHEDVVSVSGARTVAVKYMPSLILASFQLYLLLWLGPSLKSLWFAVADSENLCSCTCSSVDELVLL